MKLQQPSEAQNRRFIRNGILGELDSGKAAHGLRVTQRVVCFMVLPSLSAAHSIGQTGVPVQSFPSGPKHPIPIALIGPNLRSAAAKKSTHAPSVASGSDVGSTTLSCTSVAERPTAQTNLVPPPSMAPYSIGSTRGGDAEVLAVSTLACCARKSSFIGVMLCHLEHRDGSKLRCHSPYSSAISPSRVCRGTEMASYPTPSRRCTCSSGTPFVSITIVLTQTSCRTIMKQKNRKT